MTPPNVGVMHDTLTANAGRASDTRVVLNLPVYHRLAAAKGANDAETRREVAGISRSTEWRWKRGVTDPSGRLARDFARRLDATPADQLFVEVAA